MKWINAEQKVTVTVYDEEHEEHLDKVMTVEEMLDTYTNEGCPTIYSNPELKTGQWIVDEDGNITCFVCGNGSSNDNFCEHCGAKMKEIE